jgi:hypothetical protein
MIPWQYSSTLTVPDNSHPSGSNRFVLGALDASTIAVATLAGGNPSTQVTGNQTFNLGGISSTQLLSPDSASGLFSQFVATVRITDVDSGRSGMLTFVGTGNASFTTDLPLDGHRRDFTFSFGTQFATPDGVLQLGNNRYDVHVGDVGNDFTASVSVSELHTTPEPAPLISSAVGALLLGTLRRARRHT